MFFMMKKKPEPKFVKISTYAIGERVEKYTGAYTTFGEVRAVYTNKAGDQRFVVEVEPQGFQMIWGEKELRPA